MGNARRKARKWLLHSPDTPAEIRDLATFRRTVKPPTPVAFQTGLPAKEKRARMKAVNARLRLEAQEQA